MDNMCLLDNGERIEDVVEIDKCVWLHIFKTPDWCRGYFSYTSEDGVRLVFPIYYEGSIRRFCLEIGGDDKLKTYSIAKLSEFIGSIMNTFTGVEGVGVRVVVERFFRLLMGMYHEHLTMLDNEIENIINKIMKGRIVYKPIYTLYNRASKLHRGVHGLIYALQRLDTLFKGLRRYIDEAIMLENMYSTSIDRIAQAFNLYYTLISDKTNRVVTKLTVISAIFLPLTLIAGIYGMNFKYMPELQHPLAYPLTLTAMATLAIGELIYFKRKGWI